jgi:hypothetical protein
VVKFIQDHGLELECAVGLNAFGPVWHDVTKYLTVYGPDRMIAGDYKAFDKTASAKAMMCAFETLVGVARLAGYDEYSLTIMEGIATEIAYPVYEFNGVILQAFGSNPSGHPLTVIVNNLINSLYLRYAYYTLHAGEDVPLFHEQVSALCYGDDNVMGVSPMETKFTHTAVSKVLGDAGITYTMADKTSESVPLISLKDINFLKRGFRYEVDLDRYVAPIEEASISKLLHNVKGKKASPADVSFMAIHTANREFFLHGRDVFEEKRSQLEQVGRRHFGSLFELPSWEELVRTFEDDDALDQCIAGTEEYDEELTPQSGESVGSLQTISILTDDFSNVSMSNEEGELIDILVQHLPKKPKYRNHRFLDFGEMDLMYNLGVPGTTGRKMPKGIVNIETKIVGDSKTRFTMVCRQARKYGRIMHILTGFTVYACVATEHGVTLVKKYGGGNTVQHSELDVAFLDFMAYIAKRDILEKRLLCLESKRKSKSQKKKKTS